MGEVHWSHDNNEGRVISNNAGIAAGLAQWDAAMAGEKSKILSDTSIDDISRQELIDQLNSERATFQHDMGSSYDPNSTPIHAQNDLNTLDAQLNVAAGDGLLYKGRRFIQDEKSLTTDRPGRAQVILNQDNKSSAPQPTILNSNTPDNPSGTTTLLTSR